MLYNIISYYILAAQDFFMFSVLGIIGGIFSDADVIPLRRRYMHNLSLFLSLPIYMYVYIYT